MFNASHNGLDVDRDAGRGLVAGDDDLTRMLVRIAVTATETVPGCDLASITIVQRGRPATPVFTDAAAMDLDETQYGLEDGPSLAAIRHRGLEHCDVTSDGRWPAFNEAATRAGVVCCLSAPLIDDHATLGAFNLYSRTTTTYDERARKIACLFAEQLGLATANAAAYNKSCERVQHLEHALESRAVIEQAKGILMAAEGCDQHTAFRILVRASQGQNRKLRTIASEIVERRARPSPAPD